jgi:putative serine protease PepD
VRSPGAPTAWWTRDLGAAAPPEYDPRRLGPLGAAGGVPKLADPTAEPLPATGAPRRTGPGTAILVGVVSAVLASLVTGGLFVAFTDPARTPTEVATDRGPAPTLVAPLDIYGLLEKAQPSVVSIRTDVSSSAGTTPFGAGSGVIISEDGLVLTNAHVIAGSTTMTVALYDGHETSATLVGSFPADDIALIRMAEPGTVTPAVLGSSADIVVGDPVVAIGNALNLGGPPSVTEGIVSAKDRNIQTREGTLRNLIQTDAAINPGNSGGPLLNAQGQVVGINTAIIDDAQNIGFAIAIDLLKPLIEDLKAGRGDITPESPFLGVSTQTLGDVTDAVLERYGVTADDGAFVSDVVPGSGAAEAGLQPGDVIVAIDGQPVTSSTDVGAIIRNREAGEMLTIEIERQGEPQTITATLKSRSETGN